MITRESEERDFPISIWGLQRLPNCAIPTKMLTRMIAIYQRLISDFKQQTHLPVVWKFIANNRNRSLA
jgi:hypothetical protein